MPRKPSTDRESGLPMQEPEHVERPADVVYEDVLDKFLWELRENVMTRADNSGMPFLEDIPKRVRARLAWMDATERDVRLSSRMTLFGSADDVERCEQLRERLAECWADMAAWLIHRALMDRHPMARSRKRIADEAELQRQAEDTA